MNSYDLMLSDEERAFIKKRYPLADLNDLGMPVMGLSDVTSLEYLYNSISFDIECGSFEGFDDGKHLREVAEMIIRKISPARGWERKRHTVQ